MTDRILGTIAMICAPALLVEGILVQGRENAVITGIASMIFMLGWICANTGMRRMQATGTGKWGRPCCLSNSSASCWRSRSASSRRRACSVGTA